MFNIITPTYNRKHTLKRVYDSLLQQNEKRFIWIIVDDCSTDNSSILIEEWIKSSEFHIEYHKLDENQGKSNAVNYALNYCKEPYTIIADSDDSFEPNTLSDLASLWKVICLSKTKSTIASIWTLTKDENNAIVGDKFPKDFWQVSFKERVLENNVMGEKWSCWKTDVLAHFKMYSNSKYHIQESHTWNRINRKYDFLCVNISHRCYFHTEDGLIATKKTSKKITRMKYYNSYYGLKDIKIKEIISHSFYWNLSFDYVASLFFYSNKQLKLSFTKQFISIIIFLIFIPKWLLNRINIKLP